jgi:transcriptional regulator with XRE-family HTH domain
MENTSAKRPVHVGHNIQKFRLIRGYSQAGLAHMLEEKMGRTVSQQLVSDIEDRETVEDEEMLKKIAEILDVNTEALRNLDLDAALNVIGNTFNNNDTSTGNYNLPIYHQSTIHHTYNPLDKLIELFEKEKAELKAENERLKKELTKKKK